MMSEKPVAFDSLLNMCQKKHRRIILRSLAEEQRSLTLDDLTEAIFEDDHRTTPTKASENVLTEIRLSLDQVDLPKLASVGFVNYDREHGLVEPTEQLDQVQPILSTILDADPSLKAPML